MRRLVWPLPAILTWLAAWVLFRLLAGALALWPAAAAAAVFGLACSLWGSNWWRRVCIGLGFPLSFLLLAPGQLGVYLPAWSWLLPLAVLLLLYPVNAWRDAPVFPTPLDALQPLSQYAQLPPGAQILDAGCGAGDGLLALRLAYPLAQLQGVEWSWPLFALCAWRCPWARVRRGDIWLEDWSQYDMVYLFQRPESMTRAQLKGAELRPGAWLVSLEFAAEHLRPTAQFTAPDGRMVRLYQAPLLAL